ncbi:MAG: 50S ribosomal protein L3 [Verrucomicrobia bacterium]|nr:50S ribosomal protein L3 [Verrucomicrobiota bacterium]
MARELMGRKKGMTQRFDKDGNVVICTVIEATPNRVTQVKTKERDGYEAVQVAFEPIVSKDARRSERLAGKPQSGHYKKAGLAPHRHLSESQVENVAECEVGDSWTVDLFAEGDLVDVIGVTKGKGFQGVMKLHGFAGGPAAHGSGFHRHGGSTGMRSTPGRCLPGGPRASRMGGKRRTAEKLKVVGIDRERNLIVVSGSIPGCKNGLVKVRPAVKAK